MICSRDCLYVYRKMVLSRNYFLLLKSGQKLVVLRVKIISLGITAWNMPCTLFAGIDIDFKNI